MSARSEVLRLHAKGLTSAAIGRAVGCSRERVRQILKEEGLTHNPRVFPTDEEIAALCRDGLTNADISRVLGISQPLISAARARVGAPARRGAAPLLVQAEVEQVIALARQGMRQADIAAELGLLQSLVSATCLKHGIRRYAPRRRRHQHEIERIREQAARMQAQGISHAQIGEELGVSRPRIGQLLAAPKPDGVIP